MKRNEYAKSADEQGVLFTKYGAVELWPEYDGEIWSRESSDLRWFNFYGWGIGNVSISDRGKIIGDG